MDTTEILGQPYRARVIDDALKHALGIAGAVVIEGARASGKTMTALHAASSHVFLDDPQAQGLLEISPRSVLEGAKPRLLDEWQLAPQIWNLVRREVDASATPGRFILTGSATPSDDITRHTGAGRFLRLRQHTMSWWEKQGTPNGGVSLAGLFAGARPDASPDPLTSLDEVIELTLQSGFPAMTSLQPLDAAQLLRAYIQEVARTDVQRLADVRHAPDVLTQLIAAIARSVASEVTLKTLAADLRPTAPAILPETVGSYVGLLERLFIVERQQAWAPRLRSRARLRTSPKLHLADPALAAAALGATRDRLHSDLATLGILFESSVWHDLAVLTTPLGGEIRHYRDSNGNEIDAIIALPDGRWGAVEVKLGGLQIPAAVKSLTAAISQIDTRTVGEPSFKLIVTGNGPTLTLDDGTITCPLTALRP